MRLLITRPEPEATQTLAALRAAGHDGIVASLLRIEPVTELDPGLTIGSGPFSGVLLTSANAARAVQTWPDASRFLALPAFTVGNRTADVAREAGFTTVISADGDQQDLVRIVATRADQSNGPLLYFAGADRAGDLGNDLSRCGFAVHTIVVYRATMADVLPEPVRQALQVGTIDGVLHYSRRSVQAFVQCAEASGLIHAAMRLRHYCLSADVAAPLSEAGASTVLVARHPGGAALLELLPKP